MKIDEPGILVRINRLYNAEMSEYDIYEATRGVWKIGERRNNAKFAFAVFQGKVVGVYRISSWHPGGTTLYRKRVLDRTRIEGRWEFIGEEADSELKEKYMQKSVKELCIGQNPIIYLNC